MASGPSWRTIGQMEQARWRRFIVEHAAESTLCAGLLDVGPISHGEAVALAAVARAEGWPLKRAGAAPRRKGRRR